MNLFSKFIQIVGRALSEANTRQSFYQRCSFEVQRSGRDRALLFFSDKPLLQGEVFSLEESGVAVLSHRDPALSADEKQIIGQLLLSSVRQLHRLERVAALSRKASEEKLAEQRQQSNIQLTAQSAAMRALLEVCQKVALHDTAVFIRGESGTGKELLARYLHQHSRRSHKPFVAVNCGALPSHLIESALFGHERGAFTGATERHRGLFERAEGGTLFLDELAELPVAVQAKLLRVLQEKEFERLGGEQTIKANVRLLAATHRNIEEMVSHGEFRADLYYRLHTFPLILPPLRERRDDILPLARALLQKISERLHKPLLFLSDEEQQRLLAYQWPGNVRELENVLERAAILSSDDSLCLPALAPMGRAPTQKPSEEIESFEAATRCILQRAMSATNHKIYGEDGAAALLGLNPSTLQSKLKKLGLRY
jgi:formate hydrogenlyase transcriptional activator